jgi:hypothetical protein
MVVDYVLSHLQMSSIGQRVKGLIRSSRRRLKIENEAGNLESLPRPCPAVQQLGLGGTLTPLVEGLSSARNQA